MCNKWKNYEIFKCYPYTHIRADENSRRFLYLNFTRWWRKISHIDALNFPSFTTTPLKILNYWIFRKCWENFVPFHKFPWSKKRRRRIFKNLTGDDKTIKIVHKKMNIKQMKEKFLQIFTVNLLLKSKSFIQSEIYIMQESVDFLRKITNKIIHTSLQYCG